ncbi:MAG TPA: hypothetical protein VGF67_15810, partial [Ktedonobacteraceae bacterium]
LLLFPLSNHSQRLGGLQDFLPLPGKNKRAGHTGEEMISSSYINQSRTFLAQITHSQSIYLTDRSQLPAAGNWFVWQHEMHG